MSDEVSSQTIPLQRTAENDAFSHRKTTNSSRSEYLKSHSDYSMRIEDSELILVDQSNHIHNSVPTGTLPSIASQHHQNFHPKSIISSSNGMIAAIFEGSLAIFEQNDGAVKEVKTFSSDFAPITSLLLFCNNSVVTEDQGRVIKQWNIVSGASNVIYRQAKCCQASPDGKRIACVCSDNSINVEGY